MIFIIVIQAVEEATALQSKPNVCFIQHMLDMIFHCDCKSVLCQYLKSFSCPSMLV